MNKKELIETIDGLANRKRSFDVLKVLVEEGDSEMALIVARKLAGDLDKVVTGLERELGVKRETPTPVERPAVSPANEPSTRGFLGDDDGPGKFERWVESIIGALWDGLVRPRQTWRRLMRYRTRIGLAVAVVLLAMAVSSAYDKVFLAGYGLKGEYYLDTDLQSLYTTRLDHTVDFRWLRRPPMSGFRSEQFSVRWTGYVRADEPGNYEFYTISDDGVRLWIDDQQLIDDWNIHGGTLDKGEIKLTSGFHKVRLEYYQGNGDMVIKLQWKGPSDSEKRIIPARHLVPETPKA